MDREEDGGERGWIEGGWVWGRRERPSEREVIDFVSQKKRSIFLFVFVGVDDGNHFSLSFVSLFSVPFSLHTAPPKMSFMLDEIPFGWPGPPGNAAAERLSGVPLSRPAHFSHKRAVAKEIVQAIKAVLGGVEGVHEAMLKALERGEVREKWVEGARRRENDDDDERTKRATAKQASLSFVHFFSFCFTRSAQLSRRGNR